MSELVEGRDLNGLECKVLGELGGASVAGVDAGVVSVDGKRGRGRCLPTVDAGLGDGE